MLLLVSFLGMRVRSRSQRSGVQGLSWRGIVLTIVHGSSCLLHGLLCLLVSACESVSRSSCGLRSTARRFGSCRLGGSAARRLPCLPALPVFSLLLAAHLIHIRMTNERVILLSCSHDSAFNGLDTIFCSATCLGMRSCNSRGLGIRTILTSRRLSCSLNRNLYPCKNLAYRPSPSNSTQKHDIRHTTSSPLRARVHQRRG